MNLIILIFLLLVQSEPDVISTSLNGVHSIRIKSSREGSLHNRYIVTLKEIGRNDSIEIAKMVVRDWPRPSFYWDKESQYLIIESRSDSLQKNVIKVLNLKTGKVMAEVSGFIGYVDDSNRQFDPINEVLFYFDTSDCKEGDVPPLWAFDVKRLERRELLNFGIKYNIELPNIERVVGQRELIVFYYDFEKKVRYHDNVKY